MFVSDVCVCMFVSVCLCLMFVSDVCVCMFYVCEVIGFEDSLDRVLIHM